MIERFATCPDHLPVELPGELTDVVVRQLEAEADERQRLSRLVRETLSCSKQLVHHIGAIQYFICHYPLTRAAALPV
jgi:hypothetical protein